MGALSHDSPLPLQSPPNAMPFMPLQGIAVPIPAYRNACSPLVSISKTRVSIKAAHQPVMRSRICDFGVGIRGELVPVGLSMCVFLTKAHMKRTALQSIARGIHPRIADALRSTRKSPPKPPMMTFALPIGHQDALRYMPLNGLALDTPRHATGCGASSRESDKSTPVSRRGSRRSDRQRVDSFCSATIE